VACSITLKVEAAARQVALDWGSPTHLRDLHNHVAGLLVKYGTPAKATPACQHPR